MPRRTTKGSGAAEPRPKPALLVFRREAEEKLSEQIREGEALLTRQPSWSKDALQELQDGAQTWTEYASSLLKSLFSTEEFAAEFEQSTGGAWYVGMPLGERWQRELEEITEKVRRLRSIMGRLPMVPEPVSSEVRLPRAAANSRDVFVVHGHDDAVKESVARFLGKLALNPVILHEQPNKGRTTIEKFEGHSDVGFAVVLLTGDDVGGEAATPVKLSPRARQNVVLELGYFMGKLGRDRVCALYKEGVEIPSDIHGVLYVPLDASDGWRLKLAREIKETGIDVDLNLAM